jgi:putative ABC transport system permease protein
VFALILGRVIGHMMNTEFATPIQPWAVVLAITMSSVVGLVAGIYPAGRAAALDPVEALRAE